ncbi:ubiquitin carboxyl-terminal hydrolase MINDY-1 [Nerophis ophidion]|uniref:ubiquitin carboxyl-terminal hydrolase MINDY-1 n=1 Tax=Nerophis ophidion TaxID=159077 RepID=UPI002ADF7C8D|nr:ubiquitin carboxyl-terminal hydrolase MINDY-1 [Nerophis ophidion]XP_061764520.1 ubiquitin carboxyl-terminal hydrolase MINDY-1 [Nerophis ophidion]XP_061764521.1 ubiquitin carboxyl-terminal hydrolase MINDY-1 [Nerophis ophidion]XP_061764523.1 ubiquitin carboxyl-terminal hydrolase MINDY-1 [Nerophis ophidion]
MSQSVSSPAATDVSTELTVNTTTEGSEIKAPLTTSAPVSILQEGADPVELTQNKLTHVNDTEGDLEEVGSTEGALGQDADVLESSSVATADSSDELRESSDSASFSIPSLDMSDGVAAAGSCQEADDVLSSSYSALRAEGCSPSNEVASLKEDDLTGCNATTTATATATATSSETSASTPAYYLVKWITWKEKKTPIITQSENGPCPLLAIMNILFLRWKAKLPVHTEVVTTEDLMAHLGECVLSVTPREKTQGVELNFQQNMSDAMAVLPKLSTGLDVNVRFTGVTDFEYTPECIVFDLLDIPLYHGWLVDPQSPEMASAVGKLSYNQLVEKIIDYKHSSDSSQVSEGLAAEHFLETTATQLSYHGLCELNAVAKEGEMCVFFRNNHFSTMIKHKGHLYLLVTDQGFLREETLVWESLHNVEGDGNFCDSHFRLCHPPQRGSPPAKLPPCDQQRQIDQDYLVAVSLQQEGGASGPLSDLELARQLQQEEYQQQGPQQAAPQVSGQAASQPGGARRREKDSSDCVLL